jgi:hypothetical protein
VINAVAKPPDTDQFPAVNAALKPLALAPPVQVLRETGFNTSLPKIKAGSASRVHSGGSGTPASHPRCGLPGRHEVLLPRPYRHLTMQAGDQRPRASCNVPVLPHFHA